MIFNSFTRLVEKLNSDLGGFCNEFQYRRKQLNGNGRTARKNELFGNIKEDRGWAINQGGTTELQYHITIDFSIEQIRYGLGFNTQYVKYASNDVDMVQLMKPYMHAFLSIKAELIASFPTYKLYYGTLNDLIDPQLDRYVLWGKEVPFLRLSQKEFEVEQKNYNEILTDLQKQFSAYVSIFSKRNEIIKMNDSVRDYAKILEYKHQIILQGPPGTGKTYTAKDIAEQMIFGDVSPVKENQKQRLETSKQFKLIQFHPAYAYEDFVRGITVEASGSNVHYKTENRVIGDFAKNAAKEQGKNFVLIIDEINRANLPAVLGELIYGLEYRGHTVESMYKYEGSNSLVLPTNLYIIGTMNTADRSVGHIDYAIRRRFAFKSVLPNKGVVHPMAEILFEKVSQLFVSNYQTMDWGNPEPTRSEHMAQDFSPEDVWIGHSYFIPKDPENEEDARNKLHLKLDYEIKPLLREYVKDGILRENIQMEGARDMIDYINTKLSL